MNLSFYSLLGADRGQSLYRRNFLPTQRTLLCHLSHLFRQPISHIFVHSLSPVTRWTYHAGCSAQSELFFRLLLKNTVRWVHTPAYYYFWTAPHGAPSTKSQTGTHGLNPLRTMGSYVTTWMEERHQSSCSNNLYMQTCSKNLYMQT
jgi:hypothetical protein